MKKIWRSIGKWNKRYKIPLRKSLKLLKKFLVLYSKELLLVKSQWENFLLSQRNYIFLLIEIWLLNFVGKFSQGKKISFTLEILTELSEYLMTQRSEPKFFGIKWKMMKKLPDSFQTILKRKFQIVNS